MSTKTAVVKIDARHPDPREIRLVATELVQGKIVAFPTETVYGLAACVKHPEAVERIQQLKKRSGLKPLSYHIADWGAIEQLQIVQSRVFRFFSSQFWPGPVTLLVLGKNEEKIGVRFTKNIIATQLIRQCGELIVATSVNVSGEKSAVTAQEVVKVFPEGIDIVVDGGPTELKMDSTIIDTLSNPPQIVRPGAWLDRAEQAIERARRGQYPRKRILIVCTGNTCRSPMAEAWLRSELNKAGIGEQIEVLSRGIYARDGGGASMDAILTLQNDEVQLDNFKTHICRREDVSGADLILAMSEEHQRFISDLCPAVKDKIITLDVPDPMGMNVEHYQDCYRIIKEKILKIWPEIVK